MEEGAEQPAAARKGKGLVQAWAVLLCGAAMLYGAAWLFSSARHKLEDWTRCRAEVVGMEEGRGRSSYPLFRFTAADGQACTVRSQASSRATSCKWGDEVEVLYPPGQPQLAEIYTRWGFFKWSLALALVGAAQVACGTVMLWVNHPRTREQARAFFK